MRSFTIKQKNKSHSTANEPISFREKVQPSCQCGLCSTYECKRLSHFIQQSQSQIKSKLQHQMRHPYAQSHMQKIIKYLIVPNNKIIKRGIEIYIPEICFFQDGEPVHFYYTKDIDDYHLVKIKKQKITTTLMQKIFNQRKRVYRDRVKKVLNLKVEDRKQKYNSSKTNKNGGKKTNENFNCSIIRYVDGCETILTQLELILILQKRKQDVFWKRIQSIKNHVFPYYPQDELTNVIDISYNAQKPSFLPLYERAFILMDNYADKCIPADKNYISDESETKFLSELLEQSKEAYLTYNLYKIVAYIEVFADEKIIQGKFKMMVNEMKNCYLLEVQELTMKPLVKYDWTNEKYENMVNNKQFQKYYKQNLKVTPKTTAKSDLIEKLMKEEYQEMKIKKGITIEIQVDENERLNAQFFRFMHPNIEKNLHEIIKEDIPFKQFRKKYLGNPEERKTLFRPFNSKFVRQLHRLTPIKSYLQTSTLSSTIYTDRKVQEKHQTSLRQKNTYKNWKTLDLY